MRGLTDQERRELEWAASPVAIYADTVAVWQLAERGLVQLNGRCWTATAAGLLALRLDAAARGGACG